MARKLFAVTFDIVGPLEGDADENGDVANELIDTGYVTEEQGDTLRDAVKAVRATRTNHVDGIETIECDSHPCTAPRWVTVFNSMEYLTGESESRSLHIPEGVTAASRRRIARLVGVKL
jgi:hypothetical protein